MNITALSGREVEVSPQALEGLRAGLSGEMLVPGDPGYDTSRTLWNSMIRRSPALVIKCRGAADVVAGVRFARERELLLCIKGGGHNIAGLAAADGAVMLDMSSMRGVWIDPGARLARAQAGCLLGDVDRETQLHGLAAVLGFVSETGIVGLTLGGGFGYLTRRWGWTSDNVTGLELVTADGGLVRASDAENPDLFWGLRGGGGNFGAVTAIDYALYPVGPEIVGGPIAWPIERAPEVLEHYRRITENAPPELTLVVILRPAPPAPWLPAAAHGEPVAVLLACYSGEPETADEVIASIKSLDRPIGDALTRRPYTQLQSLLDATQPKGRRYYWKSEYLSDIDPALCEVFAAHASAFPSPHSGLILFHIGGALNDLPHDHSPVGNRDARFVLNIAGAWESEADDANNLEWVKSAWSAMRSFSTGSSYINFLTADEPRDRVDAALGSALARLAAIKRRWDPDNAFRINRNIPPADD